MVAKKFGVMPLVRPVTGLYIMSSLRPAYSFPSASSLSSSCFTSFQGKCRGFDTTASGLMRISYGISMPPSAPMQLGGRLVLRKIDLHVLEEGHVRIGQAHLKILTIVDVTVDCVGRMVPHVESLEGDALPRDQRMAGTMNAEIDLGSVVPE